MQISSAFSPSIASINSNSSQNETVLSKEYLKVMDELYPKVAYQTRDELNQSDEALMKFKEDLKTKSPTKLLADLNEEKINAIVEKYKEKLIEEQKMHPEKEMNIDTMVSTFKQRLLKALQEAQKAEQELKDAQKQTQLSTSDILTKIKMMQESEKKGDNVLGFLEQLLNQDFKQQEQETSLLL
jgi:hypothetical protein